MSTLEESVAAAQADESAFRLMLPKTGLISNYMRYTDRQESPGSFHFWSILTVLGACLQRRIHVSKGVYEVYPNLYTVLVAPSGRCRKTRAMSLATSIVEGLDWLNIVADKTSSEALLEALMIGTNAMVSSGSAPGAAAPSDSTGLIRAPELGVFLSKETYAAGMVTLLTDLYDCPPDFRYLTRNKKPVILHNVAVQLLGATTPSWFTSALPDDSFGGGFMSRFIFVVRSQRDRIMCWPESPDKDEKFALRRMIQKIRSDIRGEITITADARNWFSHWYKDSALTPVSDVNLLGFVERKPDTVLKVAMLLAAADMRNVIDMPTLINAFDIVSWTQERAFRAFQHIHLSQLGQLKLRILEYIECAGGYVAKRDVLRKFGGQFHNGVSDLESLEKLMSESGEIAVTASHHKTGRPSVKYKLLAHPKEESDE